MTGPTESPGADSGKRDYMTTIRPPLVQSARPAREAELQQQSLADLYGERLRGIWAATHGGLEPPEADDEGSGPWEVVQKSLDGVGNLALIGAAIRERFRQQAGLAEDAEDTGLAGDPSTVEFLVSTAVDQLPQEEIPGFVSGPLARTVDRLEREVGQNPDVTRERIVDIVARALDPLRGTPLVGRLIAPLHGYLSGEPGGPSVGIYTTVAVLAQLTLGLNDRRGRLMRIFLYHYALTGAWRLLTADDQLDFDLSARQLVSVSVGNEGMNLWQLLPDRTAGAAGAEQVKALRTILVATVRDVPVTEAQAAEVLSALGVEFAEDQARTVLTVLNEAGALAGPWTSDWAELARLEAASAVAAVVVGSALDQGAARLYNAAVSLQGVAEPLTAGPLRARMLLSALGLRWSLLLGTGLIDALDRLEGLDCASGFLHALGQYQDEGYDQAGFWPAAIALAAPLHELPRRLPRDRPSLAAGAAKLADAAGRVRLTGITASHDPTPEDLIAATTAVIDALRPTDADPQSATAEANAPSDGDQQAQLLDAASLVRRVFDDLLGYPRWSLAATIDELAMLRNDPRTEFLRLYQPFTEPTDSRLGAGPAVIAGVASEQEWGDLESELLHDPGTIVPALRQLSIRQL